MSVDESMNDDAEKSDLLSDYFGMMKQFLDTQERVMAQCLDGAPAERMEPVAQAEIKASAVSSRPDPVSVDVQQQVEQKLSFIEPPTISSVYGGVSGSHSTQSESEFGVSEKAPLRYITESVSSKIPENAARKPLTGHYIITEDQRHRVSRELVSELVKRGCEVSVVPEDVLVDEDKLISWCEDIRNSFDTFAGILHLAAAGASSISVEAQTSDWLRAISRNEKSFFILLQQLLPRLCEDAVVLSASGLGGHYGRDRRTVESLHVEGGSVGLIKSLVEEQPSLRAKTIDLDLDLNPSTLADNVLDELELLGGRLEIGYPQGERTIFKTVAQAILEEVTTKVSGGDVILITGGSRGITAEVLRELAVPGNTLYLAGRSPLPEEESGELKSLTSRLDIKKYYIEKVRSGSLSLTPGEIEKAVQRVLAEREIRGNILEFKGRGAKVVYQSLDVTDMQAMKEFMASIYDADGRIDGIIHGAGIIEDKLLLDKPLNSWSRVLNTKVLGLASLIAGAQVESLRFLVVFSSVAGRYGNSGQTDYATANELMNRICCQLRNLWQHKVAVRSLCWGPWEATTLGEGMVTSETEQKFESRGVSLVKCEEGRTLFIDEAMSSESGPVEVICGRGPWEERESRIGEFVLEETASEKKISGDLGSSIQSLVSTELLDELEIEMMPKGNQRVSFSVKEEDPYLQDHVIDGVSILPAAVALEMIAEASAHLWPDWLVVEVREFRMLKGVEVGGDLRLDILASASAHGDSEGFDAQLLMQSTVDDKLRIHYKATVRLECLPRESFERQPGRYDGDSLAVAKVYKDWLIHGDTFKVITKIPAISDDGAIAQVDSSRPQNLLTKVGNANSSWYFDPVLIDAAAQMAWIWTRHNRDETALPARFARVIAYTDALPEHLVMDFERIHAEDEHLVRANVYFSDLNNKVLLMIEGLESISSSALNRLGRAAQASSL